MSLINDALKKAQNRHGESTSPAPPQAGPAAVPPAPGTRRSAGKTIALSAGLVVLCVVASVTVTVLLLRKAPETTPIPVIVPAVVPTAATAPAQQPVPPIVVTVTPVNTSSSPTPITPAQTPAPAQATVVTAPSPAIEPVVITPATPPIKLGTRIQAFVDRLRVTSIRVSDTGNKAILNDRLFRVNDLVDPGLGLRLTDIQPSVLTFTDEDGNTYIRRF